MVADDNVDTKFVSPLMNELRKASMPAGSRDLRPGKLLVEPKPLKVMGEFQISPELRDQILDSFTRAMREEERRMDDISRSTYRGEGLLERNEYVLHRKDTREVLEYYATFDGLQPARNKDPIRAVAPKPRKLRIRD